MKKKRRDYGGLPGVTTILGAHLGWKTQALVMWAYKLGREGRSMRERDDAADAGSAAHAYAACLFPEAGGEPFDEEEWREKGVDVGAAMANGQRVVDFIRARFRVIAVERAIVAETFGGTIDFVVQDAASAVFILDLKTGKGIYPETCVQLGAYAWLWRIDCARNFPPEIAAQGYAHAGYVLHAPYGGDLDLVPVGEAAMAAGEQIFRLLTEIHSMRDACVMGEQKK